MSERQHWSMISEWYNKDRLKCRFSYNRNINENKPDKTRFDEFRYRGCRKKLTEFERNEFIVAYKIEKILGFVFHMKNYSRWNRNDKKMKIQSLIERSVNNCPAMCLHPTKKKNQVGGASWNGYAQNIIDLSSD